MALPPFPQQPPTFTSGTNVWPTWVWGTQTNQTTWQPQQAAWPTWVTQGTAASANYPMYVWDQWQHLAGPDQATISSGLITPPRSIPPADRRHALISRNRRRSKGMRRRLAERRAEALLLEHLTPDQQEEWTTRHAFTVHTADGLRSYRISRGMAGNIYLIKADVPPLSKHGNPLRVGACFCAHVYHPDGWIPVEDNVLAQALLLQCEGGEAQFLAMANAS